MSCDVTKFTITKGSENTFVFTIKQDDSTLPLTIVGGDTFFATLTRLGTGELYQRIDAKPLVVEDGPNGKVSLSVTDDETLDETGVGGIIGLISEVGDKVDRYYLRPTYKLIIECSTANNGDFIAKVPEVYVD